MHQTTYSAAQVPFWVLSAVRRPPKRLSHRLSLCKNA